MNFSFFEKYLLVGENGKNHLSTPYVRVQKVTFVAVLFPEMDSLLLKKIGKLSNWNNHLDSPFVTAKPWDSALFSVPINESLIHMQ